MGTPCFLPAALFGLNVYIFCAQLRIDDLLTAVKAEIAGKHVGDAAGQSKVEEVVGAEQLDGESNGRHRAVDRPAKHGHQSHGGGKARRLAQQRSRHATERRADEEGGNHLAALETAAQRHGGEQQLPEKGEAVYLAAPDGAGNGLNACAVIVARTGNTGERHNERAARCRAQVGVGYLRLRKLFRTVHHRAEEDAHEGAENAQNRHPQEALHRQRGVRNDKAGRRDAEKLCDAEGHDGGYETGQQSGIVENAHADDLQREERGGERRTEEGGETALMPQRVARRRSLSSSRKRRPIPEPSPPPIWSAAPSRPALPPSRWVNAVARKMTGTSRTGTFSPKCTASMTALVFLFAICVRR